jgi:hypothetical protein
MVIIEVVLLPQLFLYLVKNDKQSWYFVSSTLGKWVYQYQTLVFKKFIVHYNLWATSYRKLLMINRLILLHDSVFYTSSHLLKLICYLSAMWGNFIITTFFHKLFYNRLLDSWYLQVHGTKEPTKGEKPWTHTMHWAEYYKIIQIYLYHTYSMSEHP